MAIPSFVCLWSLAFLSSAVSSREARMNHAGIQLEVTALRMAYWLLHLHVYTHARRLLQSLCGGKEAKENGWWRGLKRMPIIIIMTVMMEHGKFPPDIPTCIASGSADPSLTASSPVVVRWSHVQDVLRSLGNDINHNLNGGVTLCEGRGWTHVGSFCG